jgi:hypothetical protein
MYSTLKFNLKQLELFTVNSKIFSVISKYTLTKQINKNYAEMGNKINIPNKPKEKEIKLQSLKLNSEQSTNEIENLLKR